MPKSAPGWSAVHARAEQKIAAEGWKLDEFCAHVGISETTLRKMSKGVPLSTPHKIRGFERGMGWTAGSAVEVAAGGEPTLDLEIEPQAPTDIAAESLRDTVNAAAQASLAAYRQAAANREQLVLIAEHLGVAVVPAPAESPQR